MASSLVEPSQRVHFKREPLVTSSIIIEMYAIQTQPDGSDILHIVTQGSSSTLERFFANPDLVRHVKRHAVKHPGLLRLPSPVAQRMMMDEGKDMITGLDAKANMDFLHGRPKRMTRCFLVSPLTRSTNTTGTDCTTKSRDSF